MLSLARRALFSLDKSKSIDICRTCWNVHHVARRALVTKSKEERKVAKEKRKQERKEIVGEITKGYFADLKEYGASGGKRFFAMDKLIEEKDAATFPSLDAKNLKNRAVNLSTEFPHSVTLMLLWFRAIGQNMCSQYKEAFMEEFHGHPNVKYYEVNVVEGWFYRMIKSFMVSSLQKQIPPDNQGNYLCYFGDTEMLKANVENVIVGHAFLVDKNGRIRWKAHGKPTQEELGSMKNCTKRLLKHISKNNT